MITLDPALANSLKGGMDDEFGIELPFPAPMFYAIRGEPAYKSLDNAQYYGGWGADAEKMTDAIEDSGRQFPLFFTEGTAVNQRGKEYKIYCARSVLVAPIGKRFSWVKRGAEGKQSIRSTVYFDGSRMHVQVLAYMAQRAPDKTVVPWGPVVLTAKGYQAGHILEAFRVWKKASKEARKQFASDLDASLFYLAIGTFGKDRITEKVGKGDLASQLTPISAFVPEKVTADYLTKVFVGGTIAAEMADLKAQAEQWLAAWKETTVEAKPENGNGATEPEAPPIPDGGETEDEEPF